MTKDRDWKRMGRAATDRRGALNLKQDDLVRPGLSIQTIRTIERGEPDGAAFRPSTLAAMSAALKWPAGTLISIAEGGPIPETNVDVELRLDDVEAQVATVRSDVAEIRQLLQQLLRLGAERVEGP